MSIEAYYDAGTDDIPFDTMVVQTDEGKYRISVPKVLKDDFHLKFRFIKYSLYYLKYV